MIVKNISIVFYASIFSLIAIGCGHENNQPVLFKVEKNPAIDMPENIANNKVFANAYLKGYVEGVQKAFNEFEKSPYYITTSQPEPFSGRSGWECRFYGEQEGFHETIQALNKALKEGKESYMNRLVK